MRIAPPAVPASMPALPADLQLRLPAATSMFEGWLEIVLALLRHPVARPVPVPVAALVASGLRCLNITQDTKVNSIQSRTSRTITEPSSDRRVPHASRSCGGTSHITCVVDGGDNDPSCLGADVSYA